MEMLTSLYSKYLRNNTELEIFNDFKMETKKIKFFNILFIYCVKCQNEALFIGEKLF